jgi:nucleoside 2-deoxyribosyltransferase
MYEKCFLCGMKLPPFQWTPGFIVDCPICGKYEIHERVIQSLYEYPGAYAESKHLYSGAVREIFEQTGDAVKVTDLKALLDSVVPPSDPIESLDRLLIHIARKTKSFDEGIDLTSTLYPLAYVRDGKAFLYLVFSGKELGLIDTASGNSVLRLTFAGWQRVSDLKDMRRDSTRAFVAMSFNPELLPIWEDGFKPALESVGYTATRVDTDPTNDKIDDKIIADIRKSGLVVADFTEQKGGVYFEAGFALGLGTPVIYTCREDEMAKVHFDTRQYNHILWHDADDLKTKLVNRIEATLPSRVRQV